MVIVEIAVVAGLYLSCPFRILPKLDFLAPVHNPNPGQKKPVILHPYQLPFKREASCSNPTWSWASVAGAVAMLSTVPENLLVEVLFVACKAEGLDPSREVKTGRGRLVLSCP